MARTKTKKSSSAKATGGQGKTREGRHVFGVSKDDAGTRLDIFLAVRFEDLSRSWIQGLIDSGNVRVGRRKPSKSYKLKKGERVSIRVDLPEEISLEPEDRLRSKVSVVFENENFIVVNKPAGVVVHPAESTPNGTLANWLLWKYPEVRGVGDDEAISEDTHLRPGIVHRLDKDTSGLMVIARNQKTFEWLKKQFKDRSVEKRYFALVVGSIEDDSGTVSCAIGRSKRNPVKQVAYCRPSRTPETARDAETRWKILKRYPDFTLVEAQPKTGRKHQIRVHLSSLGHPIAQDVTYGGSEAEKPKHLGRMFLHASALRFTMPASASSASRRDGSTKVSSGKNMPGGETFSFTLPLPHDLENALKNLPFMVR